MEINERIKPIKDHEGYFISENGNVYSNVAKCSRKYNKKIDLHKLKPRVNKNGYERVYIPFIIFN